MNSNDLTNRQPAIGFLETSSIAKGIESLDAAMKMAGVEYITSAALPRGKYFWMIGGAQADVEQSMQAGINIAANTVVDRFIIQNVDPQVMPAFRARIKVPKLEAVGMIETKEVASAVYAADAAVKAASVTLIEGRNVPGAKGLVVLTGEVGAVRSAVTAGVATIKKEGMLVSQVVIPFAHDALLRALTQ